MFNSIMCLNFKTIKLEQMKNILLPTDFSKNSINAINYAVNLFEHTTCHFYIINILKASSFITDDLIGVSSSATIYNTLVDTAKKSITNIISQVKKSSKNKTHKFYSIVDYDNFIDALNQTSKRHSIDLIIMGTKGATGLEKVLFGSNTVHVMQRCDVPVLAIPSGCKFKQLYTITFTSSFKSTYFIKQLKPLQYLVSLFNSKLKILHIIEDYNFEEKRENTIAFFNKHFKQTSFSSIALNNETNYNAIHNYVIDNNVQMIAMLSRKQSFFNRLFTRHSVETLAFKIDIPFLVMHNI